MRKNNVELLIFIKGQKAAIEYQSPRDFQHYIEGREGSEFEIEVVNHNNFRVEAVVSVDGLSVLAGELAGDDSSGYLVEAYGRVRIPGWKLNSREAAKFFFSGRKGGSYVEQSTGQPTNKGVIGMKVFEERGRNRGYQTFNGGLLGGNLRGGGSPRGMAKGLSANRAMFGSSSSTLGGQSRGIAPDSLGYEATSFGLADAVGSASNATLSASNASTKAAVTQTLGTGFGEAMDFQTTTVNFNRGDMLVLMVLFYDDKRGLQQRGIETVRPSRTRYATTPNPFPASEDSGCKPPAGWRG